MANINQNYNDNTKLYEWYPIVKDNFSAINTQLVEHISDRDNPHNVNKSQVGLGNVDNTSDLNKPISSAAQQCFDEQEERLDAHDTALAEKVDKEEGKGLSTEDYTTADKQKLASLDVGKQHTHSNKTILDAVSAAYTTAEKEKLAGIEAGSNYFADAPADGKQYAREDGAWSEVVAGSGLPEVEWEELDYSPATWPEYTAVSSTLPDSRKCIVVTHSYYDNSAYEYVSYQAAYLSDGNILTRHGYLMVVTDPDDEHEGEYVFQNREWHSSTPITSIEVKEDSDYESYSFVAGNVYQFASERTTIKTFLFGFRDQLYAPPGTEQSQIMIYYTGIEDDCIIWDEDVYFVDGEIPVIRAGAYYRIIAEYDPNAEKWCVGVIESGAGA